MIPKSERHKVAFYPDQARKVAKRAKETNTVTTPAGNLEIFLDQCSIKKAEDWSALANQVVGNESIF